MQIRLFAGLATLALLFTLRPALAWGPEGHAVVAHIAAMELSPHARAAVSALLGGDAEAMMALNASWADEIRDDRPETSPWHFVNIEIGDLHYVPSRDCPRDACVVAQIDRDVDMLKSNAPPARKAEALKFLIHFVGDIHQPLHAGENDDRGGNDIRVRYRGLRTNLHHVWDDDVVAVMGADPLVVARAVHAGITPQMKTAWSGGTSAAWALESATVAAREIYAPLQGATRVDLKGGYPFAAEPRTRIQLGKAGVRLAMLLNRVFR